MNNHTATPWHVRNPQSPEGHINIIDASDNTCVIKCSNHFGNAKANADFIVQAVNCHDKLRALALNIISHYSGIDREDLNNWEINISAQAVEAIAKAEEI